MADAGDIGGAAADEVAAGGGGGTRGIFDGGMVASDIGVSDVFAV